MWSNLIRYLFTQFTIASLYYLASLTYVTPVELDLTAIDIYFKPHSAAVWIYMSFFIMMLSGMTFSSKESSIRGCKTMILNSILAFGIFFFFPTKITYHEYAPYIPIDTISYDFMMLIKKYDDTYNCFPSLHVANSIIACYYLCKDKKRAFQIFNVIWLLAIVWSVMSTKQHILYDAISGGFLSLFSVMIMDRIYKGKKKTDEELAIN